MKGSPNYHIRPIKMCQYSECISEADTAGYCKWHYEKVRQLKVKK